jgi:predicted transcriptional regulator
VKLPEPDIREDRRRLDEFNRTRLAVPLDEVKAWVASWGTADELPRPQPRKV